MLKHTIYVSLLRKTWKPFFKYQIDKVKLLTNKSKLYILGI